jgi:hypothetical protein
MLEAYTRGVSEGTARGMALVTHSERDVQPVELPIEIAAHVLEDSSFWVM